MGVAGRWKFILPLRPVEAKRSMSQVIRAFISFPRVIKASGMARLSPEIRPSRVRPTSDSSVFPVLPLSEMPSPDPERLASTPFSRV